MFITSNVYVCRLSESVQFVKADCRPPSAGSEGIDVESGS